MSAADIAKKSHPIDGMLFNEQRIKAKLGTPIAYNELLSRQKDYIRNILLQMLPVDFEPRLVVEVLTGYNPLFRIHLSVPQFVDVKTLIYTLSFLMESDDGGGEAAKAQ